MVASKLSEITKKLTNSVAKSGELLSAAKKNIGGKKSGFTDTLEKNVESTKEIAEGTTASMSDTKPSDVKIPKKRAPVKDEESGPYAKHLNSMIALMNDIRHGIEESVANKQKDLLEKARDEQERRREKGFVRKKLAGATSAVASGAKATATAGLIAGGFTFGIPALLYGISQADKAIKDFGFDLSDIMGDASKWFGSAIQTLRDYDALDNVSVALGTRAAPKQSPIPKSVTPKGVPKPVSPEPDKKMRFKYQRRLSLLGTADARAISAAGGRKNYNTLSKYGFKWAANAAGGKGMWIDTRVGSRGFVSSANAKNIANGLRAEEGTSFVRFLRTMANLWSKSGKPVLKACAVVLNGLAKVFSMLNWVIFGISFNLLKGIGKWLFRGAALVDPIMALAQNKSADEVFSQVAGSFGMLFGAWIGGMLLGFIGAFVGAFVGEAAGEVAYWLLISKDAPNWEKAGKAAQDILYEPLVKLGHDLTEFLSMDDSEEERLRKEKVILETKMKNSGIAVGPGPAETFTKEDQRRLDDINMRIQRMKGNVKPVETPTRKIVLDENYHLLSREQQEEVAKTLLAESARNNIEDMTAVSWVIRNRSVRSNMNAYEVVSAGDGAQFEGWLNRNKSWTKAQVKTAKDVLNKVFGLPLSMDPTGGADHYYSTVIAKPEWAKTMEENGAKPISVDGSPHLYYRAWKAGFKFPGSNDDISLNRVKDLYETDNQTSTQSRLNTTTPVGTRSSPVIQNVNPQVPERDMTGGKINTGSSLMLQDHYA